MLEPQHHHLALLLRQFLQCKLQPAAFLEGRQATLRRAGIGFAFGALDRVFGRRRPVLCRPPVVGQPIVRDLIEPGAEPGVRTIALAGHDDLLPDILEQLLGCGMFAQLLQQEPEQRRAVAGVEQLERGTVSGAIGQHQVLVGRLRKHSRSVTDAARRAKHRRAAVAGFTR